ncbi:hypothetical protein HJC23_001134 [Cyclotella cryptica]|uniref:F5/8 type C domain-containing protein n=1 Tax=Cyclotella cryptica TaxID=29204 RepID=A0ABD3PIN3_9STRA
MTYLCCRWNDGGPDHLGSLGLKLLALLAFCVGSGNAVGQLRINNWASGSHNLSVNGLPNITHNYPLRSRDLQNIICYPNVKSILIKSADGNPIHMFEFHAYTPSGQEVAIGKTAKQSSTLKNNQEKFGPANAVDGNDSTFSHTDNGAASWEVDLGQDYRISSISIKNRYCQNVNDPFGCLCRLTGATVDLLDRTSSVVHSASFGNTCGQLNPSVDFNLCLCPAKKIKLESTTGENIHIFELLAYSSGSNVAPQGLASQSSTFNNNAKFAASNAIDRSNTTFSHTADANSWLQIDFATPMAIDKVVILNRWCMDLTDTRGCLCRLSSAKLSLLDENDNTLNTQTLSNTCGEQVVTEPFSCTISTHPPSISPSVSRPPACPVNAVKLESTTGEYIHIFELLAYSSGRNVAPQGLASQSSTLKNDLKFAASNAIDGSNTTFSHTVDANSWLQIDFANPVEMDKVVILNRWCKDSTDTPGCLCRLTSAKLSLLDENSNVVNSQTLSNTCGEQVIVEGFSCSITSKPHNGNPTTEPSSMPTASSEPSGYPTTSSIPTSSSFPSSMPSEFPFLFKGIDNAASMYRGIIDLIWDFPTYPNGDFVELESVRYHIFSYVGAYDYKSATENSIEEFKNGFEARSLNDTGIQYHLIDTGEAFEFSFNTTAYGELHSILVIAEVDGVFSRNREATELYSSASDPVMKEHVNIVGIFVPSDLLNITVREDNKVIVFDGPVREEHKNLVVGDYIFGFSTSLEVFCLLVTSIIEFSDQKVALNTEAARVEDIYDEIDFESSFGMSRPNKVEASNFSRHRHRHLLQQRRRSLFFGWILSKTEEFFNAGVKWIGDNIATPIAGVFEDLWNLVVNGEIEKSFELIDFDVPFQFELGLDVSSPDDDSKSDDSELSTNLGQLEGHVIARSDIYVSMKVSPSSPQVKVEAGWRAEYAADFELTLLGATKFTYTRHIWEGKKKTFTFAIGVVPILLDVQPKLDGKFSFEVSSEVGLAKISAGGNGGGSVSASAELPPKLSTDFKLPSFSPYFKFDTIENIKFSAGLYVVPLVEVKLYNGALTGELSFTLGPELSSMLNVDGILSGETCDVLEELDLSFTITGDVSIGTEFDESLKIEGNLFSESWPIWNVGGKECPTTGACSGDDFFDGMAEEFGGIFNTQIFLAQGASPSDPWFPSTVYKFEDFVNALKNLQGKEQFQMWLGDKCGARAKKQALVNIAAFLGDENNWDLWNADVYKEPTSPAQFAPAFYPMSSSCGQLGQSYEDYDCEDACPKDPSMEITGSTNANWIGAPPPLFCGPKSKYDDLGYWNPLKFCEGTGAKGTEESCEGQPYYYEGQTAGDHVSVRRCNFGKLNKNIGAGGGSNALYSDINFCSNPQALCDGPSELKWIAGIFFWVSEVEKYDGYKKWVDDFIDAGCTENPDQNECDNLFKYASGINESLPASKLCEHSYIFRKEEMAVVEVVQLVHVEMETMAMEFAQMKGNVAVSLAGVELLLIIVAATTEEEEALAEAVQLVVHVEMETMAMEFAQGKENVAVSLAGVELLLIIVVATTEEEEALVEVAPLVEPVVMVTVVMVCAQLKGIVVVHLAGAEPQLIIVHNEECPTLFICLSRSLSMTLQDVT